MILQKPPKHFISDAYMKIRENTMRELKTRFEPNEQIWYARIPYTWHLSTIKPSKGILIQSNQQVIQANQIDKILPIQSKSKSLDDAYLDMEPITPDMIITKTEQECIEIYNRKIQIICDAIRQNADLEIAFLNGFSPALNTQERRDEILKDSANQIAAWQSLTV